LGIEYPSYQCTIFICDVDVPLKVYVLFVIGSKIELDVVEGKYVPPNVSKGELY
jgi:hypothetical protein